MSDNVYAAPLADLDEQTAASTDSRFYVVSPRKLLVLYFMTLGLYHLYWNYKNWALHNEATGEGVWPVPRAIFSIFFTHSLFRNIASHDVTHDRAEWDAGSNATFMVLLVIGGNMMDRLAAKSIGSPMTDIASLALLVPTGLLLKKVQAEINARSGDPSGSSNAAFSAANIAWCVLGVVYWALIVIGFTVPD